MTVRPPAMSSPICRRTVRDLIGLTAPLDLPVWMHGYMTFWQAAEHTFAHFLVASGG